MLRRALPLVLLLLAACPAQKNNGADEYVVDCETVDAGQPATSDENYASFVNAEAAGRVTADACKSPELTAPASGSTLDANAPPTLTFLASHATCARSVRSQGALGCNLPVRRPSAAGRVLEVVGSALEGTAEAHCGAISGDNYLLRIKLAGQQQPLYSAMLSVTSYTPDADIWKRALSGAKGKGVVMTIARAGFLRGDINEGPYVQPEPYTFTVAP